MPGMRPLVELRDCWMDTSETASRHFAAAPRWTNVQPERVEASRDRLNSMIEAEIIPRLLLAHRLAPVPTFDPLESVTPTSKQVAEITDIVLTKDVTAALAYVGSLRTRGASLESLLLELLAPAARRLGELWDSDVCDFTQVTVGLSRLQQVLRELSPAFENEAEHIDRGARALLVPAPGEQHTFGIYMVDEFLRRAGWDVWCGPASSSGDLAALVRNEWFAVVGFSLSCETRIEALAAAIRTIRRHSRNRAVGVMVGGKAFAEQPELAVLIGADGTAQDARQAVIEAETLLGVKNQVAAGKAARS